MARRLRYRPESGVLEITQRVAQGRFLLRPGKRANQLILGVLGKALENYKIKLLAYAFLSNHYHLLLYFDDIDQLSDFMAFLSGNIAREMNRLHGWSGPFWAGRYKDTPLSTEPEVQIARLRYILSQGTKEGLVDSPKHWPGANGSKTLLGQGPEVGIWVDRTALSKARQERRTVTEKDFSTLHQIPLNPLPCLDDLAPERQVALVQSLVEDIEQQAKQGHLESGTRPAGPRTVIEKNPHHVPAAMKRKPAPFCHAASATAKRAMRQTYRAFEAAFREAVQHLKQGVPNVVFPDNSFPPPVLLRRKGVAIHPGYG